MELVDMRGLKPRPEWGPGSTPGMGIPVVTVTEFLYLTIYNQISTICSTCDMLPLLYCCGPQLLVYYTLIVELVVTAQTSHVLFLYLLLAVVAKLLYTLTYTS